MSLSPTNHAVYWIGFVIILLAVVAVSFGGPRKIAKETDVLVPIMVRCFVVTHFQRCYNTRN